MLELLQEIDVTLFSWINGLYSPWADELMAFVSHKLSWIPAYVILLYGIWKKWGWQQTLFILLAVGLLILLSDRISAGLLKPWIARYRPCRPEAGLGDWVHLVHHKCGGKYGFVSSHAANFFALATFMSLLFNKRRLTILFLSCALLTAYSRVYLGVHYPGDVIGGAILGSLLGLAVFRLHKKIFAYRQGQR